MNDLLAHSQRETPLDMTPMIDCVFLLLIFFVLVIDLNQRNLEDLVLPAARSRQPDQQPPLQRPVINVLQNGAVVCNGRVWYDPASSGADAAGIAELLRNMQQTIKGLRTEDGRIGDRQVRLIADPVLIRADKWTEWRHIAELIRQCSQPEAAFWKLELALSEVDKEARAAPQPPERR
ncbi:MAG TPA: biopolymer transporter ExbD [Planctomycetota bacterium]|nr:biopolymer transporter ExbD [Planctomycetota bacterium]